ncbi:MAG TPA: hypothetical protein VGC69_19535 [Bordetella sp.]
MKTTAFLRLAAAALCTAALLSGCGGDDNTAPQPPDQTPIVKPPATPGTDSGACPTCQNSQLDCAP